MPAVTRLLSALVVSAFSLAPLFSQTIPASQPPLWAAKPDIAAFEKVESEKLAAAQRAVDAIVAVKGPRTIDNTLASFDEALRQINTASYFAGLMQAVHPDATFRDTPPRCFERRAPPVRHYP